MVVAPAAGALGDSARTALLAAMLAVVVGVLIAWVARSTGRRRAHRHPAPSVPVPPPVEDEPPPSVLAPYLGGTPAQKTVDPDAIHLNTASYEELRKVDGIGPMQAARILAHRRAHGAFESLDELCELTGLAPERLEAGDGRRLVL